MGYVIYYSVAHAIIKYLTTLQYEGNLLFRRAQPDLKKYERALKDAFAEFFRNNGESKACTFVEFISITKHLKIQEKLGTWLGPSH